MVRIVHGNRKIAQTQAFTMPAELVALLARGLQGGLKGLPLRFSGRCWRRNDGVKTQGFRQKGQLRTTMHTLQALKKDQMAARLTVEYAHNKHCMCNIFPGHGECKKG